MLILRFWAFSLFMLYHLDASADHFLGGEIRYQVIQPSTNTYQIQLILDRYCSQSSLPSQQVLYILSPLANSYRQNALVATRTQTEYISMPCYQSSTPCASGNNQLIERTYYSLALILDTTFRNKECFIYFLGNNRSYSDNLVSNLDKLGLYLSFIPQYANASPIITEHHRQTLVNNQLNAYQLQLPLEDPDSIALNISRPIVEFSYNLTTPNVQFSPIKGNVYGGLSDQKPMYCSQTSLLFNSNRECFITPTITQNSWLTTIKDEYRKVQINLKDTTIRISSSNLERLVQSQGINSSLGLVDIKSSTPHAKVNLPNVTICSNVEPVSLTYYFPLEKTISLSKYSLFAKSVNTTSQTSLVRKIGVIKDTITITLNYTLPAADDTSDLSFVFDLCHNSGVGFTKTIPAQITSFYSDVFLLDTILSCSNLLSIPLITVKSASFNTGLRISQNLTVANPRDTWVIGILSSSHPQCPDRDSIYVNQGSIFQTNIVNYQTTCAAYGDGRAKVKVTGTNGPYTYYWSNNSNQDSIASLTSGIYIVKVTDQDGCQQTDTARITSPAGVIADWNIDSAIRCYGDQNGRGHITIQSILKPSAYQWDQFVTNDSFLTQLGVGLISGRYVYTLPNGTNCLQPFSFYIPQPDSLSTSYVKNDNACHGYQDGKVVLSGNGGNGNYIYSLSGNASIQGIYTNLGAGSYPIQTIDNKGCMSAIDTVHIAQPNKIKYKLSFNQPSCQNSSDGGIQMQDFSGGQAPFSVQLNTSNFTGNFSINTLPPGFYNILIQDDNLCRADTFVNLNARYFFQAQIDSVLSPKCFGDSNGLVYVRALSSQSPFQFIHSRDTSTSSSSRYAFSKIAEGNVSITIRDKNACYWDTTIAITEPDSLSFTTQLIAPRCFRTATGSVALNIQGGTPSYQTICKNNIGTIIPDINQLLAGQYELEVQDANQCLSTKTIILADAPRFEVNISTLKPIRCHSIPEAQLYGTIIGGIPPHTIYWNNNTSPNQTATISDLGAGAHIVNVTDALMCQAADTIILTAPNPLVIDELRVSSPACMGTNDGSITVSASGGVIDPTQPYMYAFGANAFQSSNSISQLGSGSVALRVRDAIGCIRDTSVSIAEGKKLLTELKDTFHTLIGNTISINPNLVFNSTTSESDISSILWAPSAGLSCTDCLATSANTFRSAVYYLSIPYGKNCLHTDTVQIIVSSPKDVYIPSAFSPNGDSINDQWSVYGQNISSLETEIYSKRGELLSSQRGLNPSWDGRFKGTICQIGAYLYIVKVRFLNGEKREYRGQLNLVL